MKNRFFRNPILLDDHIRLVLIIMAESLHKHQYVCSIMTLLDDVTIIYKCFKVIQVVTQGSPVYKRVKKVIAQGQDAVFNIRKQADKITYKRTVLTYQQIVIEDERTIPVGKSVSCQK